MDESDKMKLMHMMEIVEEQQAAINTALAGMEKNKTELLTAAKLLHKVGEKLAQDTGKAADDGAVKGVNTALKFACNTATDAIAEASVPLFGKLTAIITQLGVAEGKLNDEVKRFGWSWAALAGSISFGTVVATLLIGWLSVWHERSQLDDLKTERERINAEVVAAQSTLDVLNKKTGEVRYADARDGRFVLVRKGFDVWNCINGTPCIKLK